MIAKQLLNSDMTTARLLVYILTIPIQIEYHDGYRKVVFVDGSYLIVDNTGVFGG